MTRVEIHARKPLSPKQRAEAFFRADGKCCICGEKIKVAESWIDEHIIPLAMGGTNEPNNRGCAHKSCAKDKTKDDVRNIAKAKRIEAKHIGAKCPKQKLKSRGFSRTSADNTKTTTVRF